MRSFLRPQSEAANAAPAATPSPESTAPPPAETPQPGPATAPAGVESQLFDAMDRAALRLMSALDEKGADGKPMLSAGETMKLFELGERWLKNRAKSRPEPEEGEGIALLKSLAQDPAEIVKRLHDNPAFIAALEKRGWLQPLPPTIGRPSKEAAARRAVYEAHKAQLEPGAKPPPAPEQDTSGWSQFGKEV